MPKYSSETWDSAESLVTLLLAVVTIFIETTKACSLQFKSSGSINAPARLLQCIASPGLELEAPVSWHEIH